MHASLPGTWEMIRAEQNGEPSPDLVALRVELELTPAHYVVRFAGRIADRGTWLPAGAGALQLTGTAGPNEGRIIPCIFQLAGDRLRICYGLDGAAPAAFATAAGQSIYLATYRRKR
ncbi:MAG: hypothetical protein HZA93_24905 [Verrucomicrobia bacterium]|nr:hypothetical protein [Verrucomicrobiota bacterium]